LKSKSERAAFGFRVKSGWAAAVLLSGLPRSPRVCDSFVIDLCDPKIPATRQPYHAAMGKLETGATKLKARLQVVHRVTRQSIANVLAHCQRKNLKVRRAGLVVGSQIEPAFANPHIRWKDSCFGPRSPMPWAHIKFSARC
jgi:mitochondrial fission protein ELM1